MLKFTGLKGSMAIISLCILAGCNSPEDEMRALLQADLDNCVQRAEQKATAYGRMYGGLDDERAQCARRHLNRVTRWRDVEVGERELEVERNGQLAWNLIFEDKLETDFDYGAASNKCYRLPNPEAGGQCLLAAEKELEASTNRSLAKRGVDLKLLEEY